MAVLVVAEHHHGALSDATHKVVTAAAKFGGDVDVLVGKTTSAAMSMFWSRARMPARLPRPRRRLPVYGRF